LAVVAPQFVRFGVLVQDVDPRTIAYRVACLAAVEQNW
jgi:hypothetical protein